jgi:hypothetical protein
MIRVAMTYRLCSPPKFETVSPTLGSENGNSVSSASVGMANSVRASRVASAPNLYAIPDSCTMPASESLLCGK